MELLYDAATHQAICVLDTKYKVPEQPTATDVSQVVTYAVIKGCQNAILIYPVAPSAPLDQQLREIRVRSLAFSVKEDLEQVGQAFVRELDAALDLGGHLTVVENSGNGRSDTSY